MEIDLSGGGEIVRWSSLTLEPEMEPGELAFLLRILEFSGLSGIHLEIGTGAGGTLRAMIASYSQQSRPRFVVVDTMSYFPEQLDVVCENLSRSGIPHSSVDFRIASSSRAFAVANRQHETFDFILIDGDHRRASVITDLRWTELLRFGGIVCIHDYSDAYPGVRKAVDRFRSLNSHYEEIGACGSLIAFKKTRATEPSSWMHGVREDLAILCATLSEGLSWRRETPDRCSDYDEKYVESEWRQIVRGRPHPTLGPRARDDGSADFQALVSFGLQPNHTVVDFGCGSLRVGRHLIPYLEPGCYWGVDVTSRFFDEATRRLEQEGIAIRGRANLRVLSRQSVREAAAAAPDVIILAGVLQCVPPYRMRGLFMTLGEMCHPRTQILVSVLEAYVTAQVGRFAFRHSRDQIESAANEAGLSMWCLQEGLEPQALLGPPRAPSSRTSARTGRATLLLFGPQGAASRGALNVGAGEADEGRSQAPRRGR